MRKSIPFISALLLFSCSGEVQVENDEDIFDSTYEELQEDIIGPVWQIQTDSEFFEIDIPSQMEVNDQLNPEARLQYGYLEKVDGVVMENFVIVIVEEYPDEEDVADQIDIVGFTEAYVDSLMIGKEYEVLNEPALETINGMDAIVHEMNAPIVAANDSLIDLFYILGVYRGQRGLYQVLSWTLMDQKDSFRADMKRMIYSLKELN
jgi:hypothetical protein